MPESEARRPYTVVGGGAIGGTIAFHLARAGHPVSIVDTDAAHVAAITDRGMTLRGPEGEESVELPAFLPGEAPPELGRVLLAVKAQATEDVLPWLESRLAQDGFVVSLQNGLNERLIASFVGENRTVGAFVNLFADVVEPGVVRDGGLGALVVGEPAGRISDRVEQVVADLQAWGPAKATANVEGYLWAKLGFGAMLTATALADAPMADLIDRHRGVMYALAAEVFATAGERILEPFDQFDPTAYLPDAAGREEATDRLVAWLRTQPKDRSGIWRDIAVRHRPVEVHHHYAPVLAEAESRGVAVPLLRAMLQRLHEVETGAVTMSESHLAELERGL
ncbi:ketopantoate reductase family protein [Amycolatopsis jiangsuensis]|uniref:2-dehydropantoate 2-reductase/glutamate carboxypeptidase n=1 Tax=Amycolatopsis jiangsuensis TaxID=1181879 RepID=A0A840IK48_9PSEU|nr:2-dehydropantoate 2-reductase N-terminal domain-containing protein [Amycolatopsis jiangsuensis]MBB4682691.1 2-dehydropantoate 2-reductase/glutamate carboxypeptidase [Amycolatopsis jiangsuensis]